MLMSMKGSVVKQLESEFLVIFGLCFVYVCNLGMSVIYVVIVVVDLELGDEIFCVFIMDMGVFSFVFYQGVIFVFVDVDFLIGNVMVVVFECKISERIWVIVVIYFFGKLCEMEFIMQFVKVYDFLVIEDCVQVFLVMLNYYFVGIVGVIGCFFMQQGKYMMCGEGGFVIIDNEYFV